MTQLIEQLEDVNKEVGITSLRWNVNLLGSGVGWVTGDLLDRLQALIENRHRRFRVSDDYYRRWHRRYVVFKKRYPHLKPVFYPNREKWL